MIRLKLITEGDSLVKSVLGTKKVMPQARYRRSDFVVQHTYRGKSYLFNTFTKKCYQMEGEAFDTARDKRYTADEVADSAALTELVGSHFLVPEDKDEAETYVSFCYIARTLKLKQSGYTSFTILPTTACNARCIYCYEQGMQYVTMKEETVAQTIEFIKKVRSPKEKVNFLWFGGEPLVGERIIDKICAGMREAGIEYTSRMISNGSLITQENIVKMRDEWHLKRMQISLDGVEEEYNRRKNYYFNYESAYWHVLSRIKLINESGIYLTIRVNVDEGNIDGVLTMLDDIENFIVDPKLISFDMAPLFDLRTGEKSAQIWEKCFAIADAINARGFRTASHYSVSKTKIHFCMADTPRQSLVISPEGKLYSCEHVASVESLGDVWEGVTNTALVKKLESVEPAQEHCRGCFSLPQCTTFTGCPNYRTDCRFVARKRLDAALDKMLRYFEKNQKDGEDTEESDAVC